MLDFVKKLFSSRHPIVIVSGLPRSGTSMMMKMLDAGGLPPLTDNVRTADDDNPRGYYEFEPVKKLGEDVSWLPRARGKAVKVISMLLKQLPADHAYKVVFMERPLDEVLLSQRQMLVHREEATERVDNGGLGAMYERHLADIRAWLDDQKHIDVLYVPYHDTLKNPADISTRVAAFVNCAVDASLDAAAMKDIVDRQLYRQRTA